jgi:RimJ/RimL family protein N-acetyltransferase
VTRTGRPEGSFPAVEIVTARLRLRGYRPDDAEAHRAVFDSDQARRWSIAPDPYPLELAQEWCSVRAHEIRASGDGICWAGDDRESGKLVGFTGVHRTDWAQRSTEVSANACQAVLGQGYASEALRAISHWLLTECEFNRVQITTVADNLAPQRVAEACGFVREGVLRNAGTHRLERADLAVYSLVPDDLAHLPVPAYAVTEPVEESESILART